MWTVELEAFGSWGIEEPDREHGLVLAKDPRTSPKFGLFVLFRHFGESSRCEEEAGMDETVQVSCGSLNLVPERRLKVLVIVVCVEGVRNELIGLLVVRDLGIQPSEIKTVGNVLLVNFTKELVALEREEPLPPVSRRVLRLGARLILLYIN